MAYYRDPDGKFGPENDLFLDIFLEFDFICMYDGCNYFCPECRNMLKCEAYQETKEAWETFYM
jgi:hypothetical protein